MMNNLMLVGRLVNDLKCEKDEQERDVCNITLAVSRPYKNAEGIYETDFIDCRIWNNIAVTTAEYCRKGDLIGVRGRLQTAYYEDENGEKHKKMEVIAEKLTFLSCKKNNEENESE